MKLPTFTKDTDNFALAIHVGRLLMNGHSPFNGIPIRSPDNTPTGTGHEAVRNDSYCFKSGYRPKPLGMIPLMPRATRFRCLTVKATFSNNLS